MSWSYSGDPNLSRLDAVRFLVGDTDIDDQLLSDEEIIYIEESVSNIYIAGSRASEAIAGKFSRLADKSLGDYSISLSQKASAYLELAGRLSHRAKADLAKKVKPYAGGISVSDKETVELDFDRVNPAFKKDIFDSHYYQDTSDFCRKKF